MPSRLTALRFEADDPALLDAFWTSVLGRETLDGLGFALRFVPAEEPAPDRNQMHFDLTSNLSPQQETVARALALGARHCDVGQLPSERHVVLADPEGNEFCVVEEGNRFLAGQSTLGALSSDGTRATGLFWAEALGWPLIWDQDEETAIRPPSGGPIISWGGPPLMDTKGRTRLHLDLSAGGDQQAETDRLLALGATFLDLGDDGTILADPDGNEFRLHP
ncbi:hypothetical protein ACTI_63930 [Actinoplanes sp. OR16]|uniref:VOC family protein n=1 Tax=Actinoplanes sp. OR16 TaxID=946334 RepID=UPI000F6C5DA4|nr:VOC family protein [Actinoplanes sp. OR16]BBH69708.1 hypothetical protein ACTI_63930 [Actinoplanes sp. OR16]